jgi:beta-N-acetylhexosaminidase
LPGAALIPPDRPPPRAIVFGLGGETVTAAEARFFEEADPLGFILFRRNCRTAAQVRDLVARLREVVGRPAPVLIDQEGGRVARLRPPEWPALPAPGAVADAAAGRDDDETRLAAHGQALAAQLRPLGIDVNTVPVLDLRLPGASDVIGDRGLSGDPATVARLGRALGRGLGDGGVRPVVKHMPGHGRARVDSHVALPVIDADAATLEGADLAAFRGAIAGPWPLAPWGMTAHVVYTAWDPRAPATLSARVIGEIVRARIGFDGLLFSDDLCMGALAAPVGERVAGALAAGCDVALHCDGRLTAMRAAAAAARCLDEAGLRRLDAGSG